MGAEITSLALSPESVFACTGPFVGRYVRGKEYGSFVTDSDEALGEILLFGSSLVALSAARTALFVWDVPAYAKPASKEGEAPAHEPVKPHVKLDLPFRASAIVHPATYLNKVVIASESGEIAIWNIRTGYFMISTFRGTLLNLNAQLVDPHVRAVRRAREPRVHARPRHRRHHDACAVTSDRHSCRGVRQRRGGAV